MRVERGEREAREAVTAYPSSRKRLCQAVSAGNDHQNYHQQRSVTTGRVRMRVGGEIRLPGWKVAYMGGKREK